MRRVRRELRAYDPHCDIFWSKTRKMASDGTRPGRWRVVRFGFGLNGWRTVFYWEGPNGEYREPFPVEPILVLLRKADEDLKLVQLRADRENDERKQRMRAEVRDWMYRGVLDLHRKFMGGRKIIPVAKMMGVSSR